MPYGRAAHTDRQRCNCHRLELQAAAPGAANGFCPSCKRCRRELQMRSARATSSHHPSYKHRRQKLQAAPPGAANVLGPSCKRPPPELQAAPPGHASVTSAATTGLRPSCEGRYPELQRSIVSAASGSINGVFPGDGGGTRIKRCCPPRWWCRRTTAVVLPKVLAVMPAVEPWRCSRWRITVVDAGKVSSPEPTDADGGSWWHACALVGAFAFLSIFEG